MKAFDRMQKMQFHEFQILTEYETKQILCSTSNEIR